eukprot:1175988-Prorocentrum_minimum.AAC.1
MMQVVYDLDLKWWFLEGAYAGLAHGLCIDPLESVYDAGGVRPGPEVVVSGGRVRGPGARPGAGDGGSDRHQAGGDHDHPHADAQALFQQEPAAGGHARRSLGGRQGVTPGGHARGSRRCAKTFSTRTCC